MSTLEGDKLIKTTNTEPPVLLFVSCNRQPNTQRGWKTMPEHRVAKGPAHNSLLVSTEKYRSTQTSPPPLQNLSAWGWMMPSCSSTVETTSHNQPRKVPAQDTEDGVHNSPAAETPFATKPMVKGAAGTHQPSASLAHSQGDVGPVGFPGSAHRFPVLPFPFLLFRLKAMPLQTLHSPQAKIIWLGALRESRTECIVIKNRRNVSFAKFYTWRMPEYKIPQSQTSWQSVFWLLVLSSLHAGLSPDFPLRRRGYHIWKKTGIKNTFSNQTTGGKCASQFFSRVLVEYFESSCQSTFSKTEYLFRARETVSRSLLSLTGFTPKSACKASSYTGVFRKAVVSSPHRHSSLGQHVFPRSEGERSSVLSQKTIKSRNEADQDKYLHTPANTTS